MAIQIRRVAIRFALLLAAAAIVPLIAYGAVSIVSLQHGTRESIVAGNMNVATRAAEEIRRYVVLNAEILKALAADLQNTGLERWQQDRILKNYVIQFREFREISLLDESRRHDRYQPRRQAARHGPWRNVARRRWRVDLAAPRRRGSAADQRLCHPSEQLNQPAGWLVGELSLEEMWRMVDRIRIGEHGYAMVIAPDGSLLAHGDPDKKALVAQAKNMRANPLLADMRASGNKAPLSHEYINDDGHSTLGVAAAYLAARLDA